MVIVITCSIVYCYLQYFKQYILIENSICQHIITRILFHFLFLGVYSSYYCSQLIIHGIIIHSSLFLWQSLKCSAHSRWFAHFVKLIDPLIISLKLQNYLHPLEMGVSFLIYLQIEWHFLNERYYCFAEWFGCFQHSKNTLPLAYHFLPLIFSSLASTSYFEKLKSNNDLSQLKTLRSFFFAKALLANLFAWLLHSFYWIFLFLHLIESKATLFLSLAIELLFLDPPCKILFSCFLLER